MNKKQLAFFAFFLVFACLNAEKALALQVNAKGAVLMEAQSGRIVFEQDAHRKLPCASTTKIMTALLTLEEPQLDREFVVDAQAILVEGSSMGLCEGDTVTLRTLAAGMLLPSGNDAANAAAVRLAGSTEAFAKKMNERAGLLGMNDSFFKTPSGLDSEGHESTAYDLALLARAALQNNNFAAICSQYRLALSYGNPPYKRWLKNHNRLLQDYSGAIGLKTGFTKKAGRCLVSAAQRQDITLICVTLDCPDDWQTHTQLLNDGFSRLRKTDFSQTIGSKSVAVGGGTKPAVALCPASALCAAISPEEALRVQTVVLKPPFVLAPVKKGAVLGEISITLDGTQLLRCALLAEEDVPARRVQNARGHFLKRFAKFFQAER